MFWIKRKNLSWSNPQTQILMIIQPWTRKTYSTWLLWLKTKSFKSIINCQSRWHSTKSLKTNPSSRQTILNSSPNSRLLIAGAALPTWAWSRMVKSRWLMQVTPGQSHSSKMGRLSHSHMTTSLRTPRSVKELNMLKALYQTTGSMETWIFPGLSGTSCKRKT